MRVIQAVYSLWSLQLQRLISFLQYLILTNIFIQLFIGLNYVPGIISGPWDITVNKTRKKKTPKNRKTCPRNASLFLFFSDFCKLTISWFLLILLKCSCSLRLYELSSLYILFPCITSLASTISYKLLQNLYVPTFGLIPVFQFHESKCLYKSI